MRKKFYTFEEDLKKRLRNLEFKKAWEDSEVEYQLSRALIKHRISRRLSQRALAKKAKTTQAVISRIEGMDSNPSLATLKRLANALDSKLQISFK